MQAADPEARAKATVARYQAAKQAAIDAKEKGNKESQAAAGRLIRELKSELTSLGSLSLSKSLVAHCVLSESILILVPGSMLEISQY